MAGTSPPSPPPPKRDLLSTLLEEGMTMVHLDARVPGVDVPPRFRGDPHLRLNLSWKFRRPMAIHDDRVEAELTFGGIPYVCVVPYAAIFKMVSHLSQKALMWPEDVPPEVLVEERPSGRSATAHSSRTSGSRAPPRSPKLVAVPDPAPLPAAPAAGEGEPPEPTPPKRGHLRLVK